MTTTPIGTSAVTWAREHGEHYTATVALDNYEPYPRRVEYLACHRYSTEHVTDAFIVELGMTLKDAPRVILLMDDGSSVRPYYVAAWHEDEQDLIVHPFPTDIASEDSDWPDKRPVSFASWMLGPARAYHLKLVAS